ncbi:MAG TPA: ATP-binding protein, partial [Puia sp.]|nr:ATP-binding protein [Puia sp.]
KVVHTFLSTPEGKAIGVFDLPYNAEGNLAQIQKHWHMNQMYVAHWGNADFDGIAEILLAMGSIDTKAEYLSRIPAGGIHLHCLPFLQGMLYVGSTKKLKEVEINLIQSVANAFSTAYARFEDFNKLEAANIKIEKTLIDLKQAQSQLIQSEKMASLGELTAGIAHEIQNPLNFVNNFSEVNRELIDETAQAVKSGNSDEAISLLSTLKDNEDKINHHGQRADTIVKGMLQHSRSSSGAKELTNINALADEYLRLSYHGLCAKDKSFNAILNTDFDASIGKIDLIPQDIGRVLLNLYNNAFYAVNEKRKGQTPGYKPTVSVTTKKSSERVEIQVRDNGSGIPQKAVDKIFQPFFTTKPSGQGTGLGLSLSYDIVKAHGGEIKVETKEGEGSGFIIQLLA